MICFFINCEQDFSPIIVNPSDKNQPKPLKYSTELKGQVYLENQTEHSNALVYIDSLNRGVGTDSTGYFCIQFCDSDSIYNGQFKVYYFLEDFDLDSVNFQLEKGKVILDSCDVDCTGYLTTKYKEQILLVDGWTDRIDYRIGDTLVFTARFTNPSDRTLHLFIPSAFSDLLGPVALYRNKNYPAYYITPPDPVQAELDIFIFVGGVMKVTVTWLVPSGTYLINDFWPLLPAEYLVVAVFFIEDRPAAIPDRMKSFIHNHWEELHRGPSPQLDVFPNKYEFPHINIIE